MSYTRVYIILLVLPLVLCVAACSGKPVQMIQLTEQARQEATAVNADQFATEYWSAAEKAWQEASSSLDAQKWAVAETQLLKAKSNYIKARDMAKDMRAQAVEQIKSSQYRAANRLKTLKEDPAVSKLSPARKKELDVKVKQFDDDLAKAASQLQNGQYNDAKNLVLSADRAIWEAQQEFLKK